MKEIILATSNAGKIAELQMILAPTHCISQSNVGVSSIEETGLSFVENALLKARHASQFTNKPALADDSGLVVAALNGEPGIYSARYAGNQASDQDNIDHLLAKLKNALPEHPSLLSTPSFALRASSPEFQELSLDARHEIQLWEQRKAYFYCAIVLVQNATDPTPLIACGRLHGVIALSPQGDQGFGYDPIFYLPTHQCTAAQLPANIKNTISHRAKALEQLGLQLSDLL